MHPRCFWSFLRHLLQNFGLKKAFKKYSKLHTFSYFWQSSKRCFRPTFKCRFTFAGRNLIMPLFYEKKTPTEINVRVNISRRPLGTNLKSVEPLNRVFFGTWLAFYSSYSDLWRLNLNTVDREVGGGLRRWLMLAVVSLCWETFHRNKCKCFFWKVSPRNWNLTSFCVL